MSTETSEADALRENIQAQTALETEQANVAAAALSFTLQQTMNELEPKIEPFEVSADRQFFRMGRACEMFQCSPAVLREICKRAGVKFVASIDDVGILDGSALIEINRYLQSVRDQHEGK